MASSGTGGRDAGGEEPRWGRAPEDLSRSDDETRSLLRNCRRGPSFGVERPLLGGFPLVARIGKGGMGAVFLGWHPHLHQQVAIKVLPRTEHLARFQREAKLAAGLRSSHLVHVHHFDRDEPSGLYYLVMEFLVGRPASEWAREERRARAGAVSEDAALDVVIAACRGLAGAHAQGVIHRDLKPDNLFVPDDKQGRPQPTRTKVIDLGLALSLTTQHRVTTSGCALGTPGYMPPEQCLSAFHTTPASDVFGLGASLYDLLAGTPPYSTDAVRALLETPTGNYVPIGDRRGDVSPATRALVAKCLERDPTARFADAAALQTALEHAKSSLSRTVIEPARPAFAAPARPAGASRRGMLVGGAVLLVASAALGGAYVLGGPDPAHLDVDSLPPGAEVRVDDRVVGRTPLTGFAVAPGDHTVELRADEHEPWKSPVRLAPGAAKCCGRIALQAWGSLDLTEVAPGTEVWLGDRRLADGARVPPAPQEIVLRKAGAPDRSVTVLAPLSVRVKPPR